MRPSAPPARPVPALVHSSVNTLLNKGKPAIVGVNSFGRLLVLSYLITILGLDAVAFTRILPLTHAVI